MEQRKKKKKEEKPPLMKLSLAWQEKRKVKRGKWWENLEKKGKEKRLWGIEEKKWKNEKFFGKWKKLPKSYETPKIKCHLKVTWNEFTWNLCTVKLQKLLKRNVDGLKTFCNACGVRYKFGYILLENRPAASPTFVPSLHSDSHKRMVEMRKKAKLPTTVTSSVLSIPPKMSFG